MSSLGYHAILLQNTPALSLLAFLHINFSNFLIHVSGTDVQAESTTLADMRRVWLSRKMSYIFEASPSSSLGFFMQSLYAHSIGWFNLFSQII